MTGDTDQGGQCVTAGGARWSRVPGRFTAHPRQYHRLKTGRVCLSSPGQPTGRGLFLPLERSQ